MIALAGYRVTAYVRSHRVYQALLLALALLTVLHGSRVPAGQEGSALADGAVLLVPVLAWAARSLLDTEPDRQREMSAVLVGGRGREVASGLIAAFAVCAAFAALAMGWALLLGVTQRPSDGILVAGAVLYVVSALTGTALGALTSRAVLPSPAVSIMALVFGYLAMLLLSAAGPAWLTVPLIGWMRAASLGELAGRLPELGPISLVWCAIGLAAYAWLRHHRT